MISPPLASCSKTGKEALRNALVRDGQKDNPVEPAADIPSISSTDIKHASVRDVKSPPKGLTLKKVQSEEREHKAY